MGSNKMIYLSVLLVILPCLQAITLRDIQDSTTLQHLKEEISLKHPDLVKWFERATERLQKHREASVEDLQEVRALLRVVRDQIHEFVSSKAYLFTTTMIIEQIVAFVEPLLGVMPLPEISELYNITSQNPDIQKLLESGDPDIVEVMTGNVALKEWFVNTTHVMYENLQADETPEDPELD